MYDGIKLQIFTLKKVEFLDMPSDGPLFNNDLYIVNENRNKFELF